MKVRSKALMVSLGLGVMVGGYCFYESGLSEGNFMRSLFSFEGTGTQRKKHKIAILIPSSVLGVDEIEKGFIETLSALGVNDCEYRTYDANGSRALMRSHVEDILQNDFDLVCSVGAQCSQTLKEMCVKKNILIPSVFVGVVNPVELNIVKSREFSGNNFTGVIADLDYKMFVEVLCMTKKNMSNALIVYDPTQLGGYTERTRKEVEEYLYKKGVHTKAVQVFSVNEIAEKVKPFLDKADVLITLRDYTTNSALDIFTKLCAQHGVTFCASDLGAVDKGADLGFGYNEFDFGAAAAQQAKQILIEGKKPKEIRITGTNDFSRVRLSKKAIENHSLDISPNMLFLIKNGELI